MKIKKLSVNMFVCFVLITLILSVMPLMPQGKLVVHIDIDPPTVPVGQPTDIRVEVLSAPDTPLPGAHVEISAGGGVFQPAPGQGSQIFANASANPPIISRAQPTVIRVEAFSEQGDPIPGAYVKISAGGGFFIDSNNTTVEGNTEADGAFETPWKCIECAPAYVFAVEVNKPGFKGWQGETRVEITDQPGPVQGGPINVNASTHPDTVSQGQPTEIKVEAFSNQGDPIPDAHVKISAGGGMFLDSNGPIIEGQTDINGVFVTPWKCTQCAPAYVFDVEVDKPDFEQGKAEARVNIK